MNASPMTNRAERWREVATFAIVLAGAFGFALVFSRDSYDMFRLPKTLFLQAEAILLAAVALIALVLGAPIARPRWSEPAVFFPLLAMAAMLAVTATSTRTELSVHSLGPALATLAIFLATAAVAREHGWPLVIAPIAAALVNAIILIAQATKLWMPFGMTEGLSHHLQCTALIGNPNEVGGYAGTAALAGVAAVAVRRSVSTIVPAAILFIALIVSRSLTAMIAFTVAAVLVFAMSSWRRIVRDGVVAIIVAVVLFALIAPLRTRAANIVRWAKSGEYNAILTERLTPFVAASLMIADRPLTGVGPGAFAWHYYDYKLHAEKRFPSLRSAYNRGLNYGEVHNDHLQVLAEGGLVGYAAFVVILGALAAISLRIPAGAWTERAQFARRLALPLAVFWIILSLAQFPLETPVVRGLLVHFAALCAAWRSSP